MSAKHVILGAGNPLLDISADVPLELVHKYGLKMGDAVLAGPEHQPLYAELVEKYNPQYIPGGATQNSIRVAQWMSGEPACFGAYMGSVGADAFGAQLKACAEADGVSTYYYVDAAAPTGTCACLIHEKERSLCTNLAAANNFSPAHLDKPEVWSVVEGARIIYSAGFFLTVSVPSMVRMGKHCAESGKIYALNLSAPFLCEFFKDGMHEVLPYADFVFGNESEAASYAKANGFEGASVDEVALRIAALPKASSRPRIVVITQGAQQTVIAEGGAVRHIAVKPIASEAIVDVNGAGDAFVGGFLAYIAKGASVDEAVKAGNWAAGQIIQVSGTQLTTLRERKYVPE